MFLWMPDKGSYIDPDYLLRRQIRELIELKIDDEKKRSIKEEVKKGVYLELFKR